MYIRRLIYNKYSPYVIAIILGLGLSCMFRKVCKDRNCLVFKAPPLNKIKGKIYKYGGACYTFESTAQHCDKKMKIVNFA